ncbi:MAG: hypothetical protein R3F19_12735 [Verrucomicrobiales bacterium]
MNELEEEVSTYALGLLASHLAAKDVPAAVRLHGNALVRARSDETPLGEPTAEIGYSYARLDPAAASRWA